MHLLALPGDDIGPEITDAALAIGRALDAATANPAQRTSDLGGTLGTRAFGAAVASRLARAAERAPAAA